MRQTSVLFGWLWLQLRGRETTPRGLGVSVGMGLFVGLLPLFGLHWVLCLLFCRLLRQNCVVAYAAAQISVPWVAPGLVLLELQIGSLVLWRTLAPIPHFSDPSYLLNHYFYPCLAGGVLLGLAVGATGGALTYAVAKAFLASNSRYHARRPSFPSATTRRYRNAPRRDRYYVELKLRIDPIFDHLTSLPGQFGALLDAGCGRGQLALALLDVGKASSVEGFDANPKRIEVARLAGEHQADFYAADLRRAQLARVDTILLIDVLHYLSHDDKLDLLRRTAHALNPRGRLLLREIEVSRHVGNVITRWWERIGLAFGSYPSEDPRRFVSSQKLERHLVALGFRVELKKGVSAPLLDSYLAVATLDCPPGLEGGPSVSWG